MSSGRRFKRVGVYPRMYGETLDQALSSPHHGVYPRMYGETSGSK